MIEAKSMLQRRRLTKTAHATTPISNRGTIATIGSLKSGTSAYRKEKMPNTAPPRRPTTGPSSAPPTIAGMCIMVAFPMRGIGTGIKPRRVAPRNNAMPPIMPLTTICRVSKLNTEPPLLPPEFAATYQTSVCSSA
jgi:hypothetical protein